MKFIHLTDLHVIAPKSAACDSTPAERLALAVDSINTEHADAELVVVTGDLTHWGNRRSYDLFLTEMGKLSMPFALITGNHDKNAVLKSVFPAIPCDEKGFVQQVLHTTAGPFILMDTVSEEGDYGVFCADRRSWLDRQLASLQRPALLFMHHPPFKAGIPVMDDMRLRDADALFHVLDRHRDKVRHLFCGHLHRTLSGNWRGFSISVMRSLHHQSTLGHDCSPLTLSTLAYGIVLVDDETVIQHQHCFVEQEPGLKLSSYD